MIDPRPCTPPAPRPLAALALALALAACEREREAGGAQGGAQGGEAGGAQGGEAGGAQGGEAGGAQGGEAGGAQGGEAGGAGGDLEDDLPSDAPGRYRVGYRVLRFEYALPEPLARALSEDAGAAVAARALRVAVWYPTDATDADYPLAAYPVLPSRRVALDAPPLAAGGRAPVLLYSHGAKVWPELGAFMSEHFASHGWVAVAVEHDLDHLQSATRPRPDAMYLLRPLDASRALDHLLALPPEDPLAGALDPARVAAAGHSYGGYTAFALAGAAYDVEDLRGRCADLSDTFCERLALLEPLFAAGARDPRVRLAIPQSAGNFRMFGAAGVAAAQAPVLHISARRDQDCTEEGANLPYWEALRAAAVPRHWLSLLNAGHASLTVSCAQFPTLELDNGCGEDFTPPEAVHRLANHYALSAARRYASSAAAAAAEGARPLLSTPAEDNTMRFTP